jgi:hypothetical protein
MRDVRPLQTAPDEEENKEASSEKTRSELLTLKLALWGMSIDLKELWRRARRWWKNRR